MENLTFSQLAKVNKRRQREWGGSEEADLPFRMIEVCGEVGELAEAVKKYLRAERGILGSTATMEDIEDEVGDVVISLTLLCEQIGISLGKAVIRKFNKTSTKYNLETKL